MTAAANSGGGSRRPPEVDAARQALSSGGAGSCGDSLDTAAAEALRRSQPGDLLVLLGAQGMNDGRRMLEQRP